MAAWCTSAESREQAAALLNDIQAVPQLVAPSQREGENDAKVLRGGW